MHTPPLIRCCACLALALSAGSGQAEDLKLICTPDGRVVQYIASVPPAAAQKACAALAAGPSRLRQFIWRTRMIYGLYYDEFEIARGVG
jgi:hypothetical protein